MNALERVHQTGDGSWYVRLANYFLWVLAEWTHLGLPNISCTSNARFRLYSRNKIELAQWNFNMFEYNLRQVILDWTENVLTTLATCTTDSRKALATFGTGKNIRSYVHVWYFLVPFSASMHILRWLRCLHDYSMEICAVLAYRYRRTDIWGEWCQPVWSSRRRNFFNFEFIAQRGYSVVGVFSYFRFFSAAQCGDNVAAPSYINLMRPHYHCAAPCCAAKFGV